MDSASLTPDELARYQRQLILPELGVSGQERLRRSSALVVGAGGLGSPAALYLTAAGIGTLGIVDADRVEPSNLQRQVIHGTGSLGREKTASALDRLRDLNPHVAIAVYQERLTAANAEARIREYDIVLGCVDNLETRYVINTACVALRKPNVFASVTRFEGQASVFTFEGGPCYQCFFREPPGEDRMSRPEEKAVLGTVPGIIGGIQANEALKTLLGVGRTLSGRLLLFDALGMRFREIPLRRDPACPACGTAS